MKSKLKICIISIYFGKLPEWFDIWLSTAIYNTEIDFLLVTDQSIEAKFSNLRIIQINFNEFKILARKKMGFEIKLNTPYKLCDYKEVWGIILEDELMEYDYWGECDNDIIFGDLSYFFEKYNLKQYDKFGCRGHLTLYRNTKEVNERYKLDGGWFGNYKEVFSSNRIWAFDETPGINAIYEKHNFSCMKKIVFADIDVNYNDIRLVEFDEKSPRNFDKQLFYWSKGKILRKYVENGIIKEDEFMYVHLQKRKMERPSFNSFVNNDFFIVNGRFIKKETEINIELFDKYNLKQLNMRTKNKFGGAYKKDLRFYWLGRRFLNFQFELKKIIKNTYMYKIIMKGRENVTKTEKMIKYFKNGMLFHLLKEKINFKLLNIFTKNKNITIKIIQSSNYKKLKKEFSYVLNEEVLDNKDKVKSNKVWFCWLQGYDQAPSLVKACFNSFKKNMPNKEIVFLSEENIDKFIEFPEYINKKYASGNINKAHYSDLIRISLLCKYGGMWVDSTVLCTSPKFAEYVFNQPLFVYKQLDLTRRDINVIVSSNWLISAESNNEICRLTQKLLFEYWKKYNYAIDYFIFHLFFTMSTERYNNIWNNVPTFCNIDPHIMQFELNNHFSEERWNQITNISGFHKLNHHLKYNKFNTIYAKILKEFLKEGGFL